MNLKLNAEEALIKPDGHRQFIVELDGIDPDKVLQHFDTDDIVSYFDTDDLLQEIGSDAAMKYFNLVEKE